MAGRRAGARFCSGACRAADNRMRSRMNNRTDRSVGRPAQVATVTAIRPPVALTWEPPSEPRMAYQTAEPCPTCGAALTAEPRGTWRGCLTCKQLVAPPGVSAPYASGASSAQRQVKSQRERDQEARALESRRQRLADELDGLGADKRLTSEARGTLKWYRAEVDKAKTMSRLDDLVDQFRDERLTRTGWLARPAAAEIEPPDDNDWEYDDDVITAEVLDEPPRPRGILPAITASAGPTWTLPAGRMTWADALGTLGWHLVPPARGCQISEGAAACGAWANRGTGNALICYDHYQGLAAVIMRSTL